MQITSPPTHRNPRLPAPADVSQWTAQQWEALRNLSATELKTLGMLPWAVDAPEERLFDVEPTLTQRQDGLTARAWGFADMRRTRVPEAEYQGKALYLFPREWLESIPTDFLCVDIFGQRGLFNPLNDDVRCGALSSGLLVDP